MSDACMVVRVNGADDAGPVVIGQSTAPYESIAAFIAGEPSQSAADVAAASSAGSVTATALPAWLAVGDYVVDADATPGTGLVYRFGKILTIVGNVITFDAPWNFGAAETLAYRSPQVGTLVRPQTENVTFTNPVIFNGGTNQLTGTLDVTAGVFTKVTDLSITNGVTFTSAGVFILEKCDIDARAGTIYSYIMTSGSNLGRTIMFNCQLYGVVAGRRGYGGWEIDDCRNNGIAETDQNCPWRPFEALAALTLSDVDIFVTGEYAGCIVYSSHATGATGTPTWNVEINGVKPKTLATINNPIQQPTCFGAVWVNGAGVANLTPAAGGHQKVQYANHDNPFTASIPTSTVSQIRTVNMTGSCAFSFANMSPVFLLIGNINSSDIVVTGSSANTGNITITGGFGSFEGNGFAYQQVRFDLVDYQGTLADGNAPFLYGCNSAARILFNSCAIGGTPPTVTLSGAISSIHMGTFQCIATGGSPTVSAGTFTISGAHTMAGCNTVSFISVGAFCSGGTWAWSGTIAIQYSGNAPTTGVSLIVISATGGTFTVSSSTVYVAGFNCGGFTLASCLGAGATVAVTAATVRVRGFKMTAAVSLIVSNTATSTTSCTGAIQFEYCSFGGATIFMNATTAGGSVTGSTSVVFYNCNFESTFADRNAIGTVTLATANWQFNTCTFTGLFTATGTSFTTLYWFTCTFKASPIPITISGTRPTNLTAFKCQGLSDLWLTTNTLEVVDEYFALNTAVGVTQGDLITMGIGIGKWETCTANTDIVEGIALTTVAAAGQCIGVVRGRIFVRADASVLAKDYCIQDPAAPHRAILGAPTPGKGSIRAFENAGATIAGKAYSSVGVF